MEKLIAITGSLPESSKNRHELTCKIVDTLWDSLQHPPLSYYGEKYQYRTPDGSYNVGIQVFCHDVDVTAMVLTIPIERSKP